ncbi:MAG: serine/threonine-protein kinase [Candidatus Sumerlaeia bacterium]|nr:serine/threonine-protein kinase [Candidatus Sumerlaeia bacterium]
MESATPLNDLPPPTETASVVDCSWVPDDIEASYDPSRAGIQSYTPSQAPAAAAQDPETAFIPPGRQPRWSGEPGRARFELRAPLARGGCGEVWEALQVPLHRRVAVKRLREDIVKAVEGTSRAVTLDFAFRQEAFVSAALEHPNIVPVYDLGADAEGRPLLAMKKVEGRSWRELLRDDFFQLPEEEYYARHIPILMQVSLAVAYAHSRGVVHRDLKPSQVMVGDFGEVLLMDWGLSLVFREEEFQDESERQVPLPTREFSINPAGTPAFMAPEQTTASADGIGPWTDVYLLGGMLYFLLALHAPHAHADKTETLRLARAGVVPNPSERAPHRFIPPELERLVADATAPRREDRIAHAEQFHARLAEFLGGTARRKESLDLTAQVEEALRTAPADYEALAALSATNDRAAILWPANPRARELRQRVSKRICDVALERGDLSLAATSALRLDEGRAEYRLRVADARERMEREERQRRTALAASAVLVAAVVLLISVFSVSLAREKSRAEAARDEARAASEIADAARADSERLLSFALGDLRERLDELGRPDLLSETALRALEVYRKQPWDRLDEEGRLRLVSGLIETADVFATIGNVASSGETVALVEEYTKRGLAEYASPRWKVARAETLSARAEVEYLRGDSEAARGTAEAAADLGRRAASEDPSPANRRAFADFLSQAGNAQADLDDSGKSFLYIDEATAVLRALVADGEDASVELAEVLVDRGRLRMTSGKYGEAEANYAEALALLPADVDPARDAHAAAALAGIHGHTGWLASLRGDLATALSDYEKSHALWATLHSHAPANTYYAYRAGRAIGEVAETLFTLGRLRESRQRFLERLALTRQSAALDPEAGGYAADIRSQLSFLAVLDGRLGDAASRRTHLEAAAAMALDAREAANDSDEWRLDYAEACLDLARLDAEEDRFESATALADGAEALLLEVDTAAAPNLLPMVATGLAEADWVRGMASRDVEENLRFSRAALGRFSIAEDAGASPQTWLLPYLYRMAALADRLAFLDRPEEAETHYREALRRAAEFVENGTWRVPTSEFVASTSLSLAELQLRRRDPSAASAGLADARAAVIELADAIPDEELLALEARGAHLEARLRALMGDATGAAAAFEEAAVEIDTMLAATESPLSAQEPLLLRAAAWTYHATGRHDRRDEALAALNGSWAYDDELRAYLAAEPEAPPDR